LENAMDEEEDITQHQCQEDDPVNSVIDNHNSQANLRDFGAIQHLGQADHAAKLQEDHPVNSIIDNHNSNARDFGAIKFPGQADHAAKGLENARVEKYQHQPLKNRIKRKISGTTWQEKATWR